MAGSKRRASAAAEGAAVSVSELDGTRGATGAKGKARTSGSKTKRGDKTSGENASTRGSSSPVAKRARGEKEVKSKEKSPPAKAKKGSGAKAAPAEKPVEKRKREVATDDKVTAKKGRAGAGAKDLEAAVPAKKGRSQGGACRTVVFGASADYAFLAPVCGRLGLNVGSEGKLVAHEKVRCVISQSPDGAAFLAMSMGVPVVSPEWLYVGLGKGELPPEGNHLLFPERDSSWCPLDDMTVYTIGRWPQDCGQGLHSAIRAAGGRASTDPFIAHDLTVILDPSADRPPREKGPKVVTVDWLIGALTNVRPPPLQDFLYVPPSKDEQEEDEISPPKAKRRRDNATAPTKAKAKANGDETASSAKAKPKPKGKREAKKTEKMVEKKEEVKEEEAKEEEPKEEVANKEEDVVSKSPPPPSPSPVDAKEEDKSESEAELSPPTPVRRSTRKVPSPEPPKDKPPPASPPPLDPTVPATGASFSLALDSGVAAHAAMSPTFSKMEDEDEAEEGAGDATHEGPSESEKKEVARRLSFRPSNGQQTERGETAAPEADRKEDDANDDDEKEEQEEEADEDSNEDEMEMV
eukprot:Hpha_TRINITY_DN16311_c1_g6::TRINITY_DN16311_c1_g6_i1::g.62255::m.62255